MDRGFILQHTYRIEGGRPVVLIYGVLESGKSFLVKDTREIPHFFIREADASHLPARAGLTLEASGRTNFRGEAVARVAAETPRDIHSVDEMLSASGVHSYEADVGFSSRYLIDRGIRASIGIQGAPQPGEGTGVVFENPEVCPSDWVPQLSILSFDIETDPAADRLLSISLAGCGASDVLLLTPRGLSIPEGAVPCRSESELVQAFIGRVRELDPDILTGWNVIDFDLVVVMKIARRHGIQPVLGRGREPVRLHASSFGRAGGQATVQGRLVLDGIRLLRGAFLRFDSYALGEVARRILGKEKTVQGPNRADEILRIFHEDRPRFVAYNLNDARLVLEILDKLHLIDLAVERSRLTGLPPDRVTGSIAAFDFLYLTELARRGVVAPTLEKQVEPGPPGTGGHVIDPAPGLYRNVLVFDFKSLYPSIIRTFQIDPLGHAGAQASDEDLITAPNGAAFLRRNAILPRLLDDLFERREAARAAGDAVTGHAVKILMNSFYGVLGTPACRFASPAIANAITGFGREILLWTKDRVERRGYRVLYGDTDSLFVLPGLDDPKRAGRLGVSLAEELTRDLAEHIVRTWGVESRLELQFEKLYLRLFLPPVRHGGAGARKRYAGLVQEKEGCRVSFTGMEAVRRDWTELAKEVQRELYTRLFSDRPVEEYLRRIVVEMRAGRLDHLLIYRKAIRKNLASYVASTPPHVAAARKKTGKVGSLMDYVITVSGPEPADERRSAVDYEHYVQKQIRAVADPVLALLGLRFDQVVGDEAQLRLF